MAVGQHKTVAVVPLRVERVVFQMPVPQHFGDVGHAHRGTGVARLGRFDGVNGQHAHGVGHAAGHLGGGVICSGVHGAFAPLQAWPRARLRRSIIRHTNGVKISCMAISILPPGTTIVLARLIQESLIMLSK